MLFLKLMLLVFITHEIMRIINLNEYYKLIDTLKKLKEVDKTSDEYRDISISLYTNPHLILLYVTEILYTLFTLTLLFTPFYLVGIALLLQASMLYIVKKDKSNDLWIKLDSIISVVIMALGVILIN